MRFGFLASVLFVLLISPCKAADLPQGSGETFRENKKTSEIAPEEKNSSMFFFTGRLSATSLGSTLKFNLDHPADQITYDNYISGAAFAHDFYQIGFGFKLGAEVGTAVRFGPYVTCCDPALRSSAWVHSEELWVGPRVSHEGFVIFDNIRIAGAVTWGLSFSDNSIGFERGREIAWGGSARTLFYFGPEIIVSLRQFPNFEFVFREHHRSGANGTLGNLREGYNANVFGIRYKF